MDTTIVSDEELILRSRSDPSTFGLVFDRYAPTVFRFAWRRVGSGFAEDVTAETFRVAFERRDTFDPARGAVLPWLFGIATNVLHSHHRAERRQLRAARIEPGPHDALEGVEERLDAAAVWPFLARALLTLGPEDRDTLLLFAWTDLGYEGVARALDIPVGTVGSRLSRARRIVRMELRRAGFAPDPEEGVDR